MMKFVCDRCGKRYATAEDPAAGKVYKLRCKACGNLMVVRGQAGTSTGIPVISADEIAGATQVSEPIPTPLPGAEQPELLSDDAIEQLPPAAALPPEVARAIDAASGGTPELEILGGGRGLLKQDLHAAVAGEGRAGRLRRRRRRGDGGAAGRE